MKNEGLAEFWILRCFFSKFCRVCCEPNKDWNKKREPIYWIEVIYFSRIFAKFANAKFGFIQGALDKKRDGKRMQLSKLVSSNLAGKGRAESDLRNMPPSPRRFGFIIFGMAGRSLLYWLFAGLTLHHCWIARFTGSKVSAKLHFSVRVYATWVVAVEARVSSYTTPQKSSPLIAKERTLEKDIGLGGGPY